MIAEWTQDTTELFNRISAWCDEEGWATEKKSQLRDVPDKRETLEVETLSVTTPDGRIHLEPIGQRSDGRILVEVYAWPTLVRVHLVEKPGGKDWEVTTDVGVPFHYYVNKESFIQLVHDLQVLP